MLDDWHGWVGTFTGVAAITVGALPLAALASRRWWRSLPHTVPCNV